jgi:hypothetical protein
MELGEIYDTIDKVKGHNILYENALNFLEKLKLQNNV